ncbi:MAG: site-specific DNA-methyltransferase, partial [Actinomycetota bacterium]
HQANWSNRMILGDSLQVMGSLAEREGLRGKVQMIYLDPPYGIKFGSNWQVSTRKRDVKDGKYEDATFEVEQIKAFRDTWELGIHSYLQYLRDRLMVARDLLTESGSVFVQIGDENVHLVRALMDEVFGSENFVAQIYFRTTSGRQDLHLDRTGNYVLWCARDVASLKSRKLYESKPPPTVDEDSYDSGDLQSQGVRSTGGFPVEVNGRLFKPLEGNHWKVTEPGMQALLAAGRVHVSKSVLRFKRYASDFPATSFTDAWLDTGGGAGRDKVYVVQTGTKVIERCMLMCTDPGDLVLDPTCGSGTTAYVAELFGRRWITCDTSRVALALARQRLMASRFPYFLLADSPEGRAREQALTGAPLPISESRGDIRQGFVYERVQHITLKSIANNPDIREGMTRDEIDAAIKRHADFELLYDKPYEDNKKVRVAGPFTVESLSPHRSIAFAGQAPDPTTTRSEEAGEQASAGDFEQMILDNLRKAGIQNGRRNERLTFATIEPYPGVHVHAIGERETDDATSPKRVGVVVGPQYGTVGSRQIMDAAK